MAVSAGMQEVLDIENQAPLAGRWKAKTVYQRLMQTRDAHGARNAVSFQLKSGPKDLAETLTWNALTKRVNQAANLFRSLGVGENDTVAYLLPSTNFPPPFSARSSVARLLAPLPCQSEESRLY